MRSDELRKYGEGVLQRDPSRVASAEILDLMAYLVECDFVGAEAKLATIKYKFRDSKEQLYVNEGTSLARAHINFAFGRFDDLEESAKLFLEKHEQDTALEKGEYLDILRLLAQKSLLLDDYERLEKIYQDMSAYQPEDLATNQLYLCNSIYAMVLMARGEANKANQVASQNIEIAKQNNYLGLMAPMDSMFVLSRTLLAFSRKEDALKIIFELKKMTEKYRHWPWYFMADGSISQEYAVSNRISEALAIVREQREKITAFTFPNNLSYMADANELFIRFVLRDQERIETLISRLPELNIVKQVRPFKDEWSGKEILPFIEKLPERNARERIYKYTALAGYYHDKESIAIDYMLRVLPIIEETGFIEYVLRQFELFDVIQKAIIKKPTPFLEDLASKITERIRINALNNQVGMPVPLTTRELEVVRQLATGKPISNISNTLHVSMNTMKTHLRNIYRKLDVDGRDTAVEKAKELFLI